MCLTCGGLVCGPARVVERLQLVRHLAVEVDLLHQEHLHQSQLSMGISANHSSAWGYQPITGHLARVVKVSSQLLDEEVPLGLKTNSVGVEPA